MAGARSRWWTRRDTQRLISRAEASSGTVASVEELRYMRAHAELLLRGPLELADSDRVRVGELYACLVDALSERAIERIGGNGGGA